MTARVTISLPDELLDRLDAEADELGVPRSELVQESLASYLGQSAEERATAARRFRMREAIEGMRTMAQRYPSTDTRPGLDILREVRETHDAKPRHGSEPGRRGPAKEPLR